MFYLLQYVISAGSARADLGGTQTGSHDHIFTMHYHHYHYYYYYYYCYYYHYYYHLFVVFVVFVVFVLLFDKCVLCCSEYLGGTQTGSYRTGSYQKGRFIPPKPTISYFCFLRRPRLYASDVRSSAVAASSATSICRCVCVYVCVYIYIYIYIHICI